MPNIINADNGLVSGSVGLKYSCDNTGVLALQTSGNTAMTIDGSGNVGIGTTSSIYKLDVTGTFRALVGSVPFIVDGFGAVQAAGGVYVNTSGTRQAGINSSGIDLRFRTGNADDRMIIDSSGNVGIGTSSPSSRLHVKGTDVKLLLETNTGATSYIQQLSASPYNVSFYNQNAGSLIFGTSDTERMRIDSAGNVGIGNTPSGTSATGYRSLELGTTAGTGITAGNGDFYIPVNAYVAGGAWKYATTSTASLLNINTTTFTWSNAGSGTAGNNISFTERMRIDSSGNLWLQTVGTANIFQIGSTSQGRVNGTSRGGVSYYSNSNNSGTLDIGSVNSAPDQINFYTSSGFAGKISSSTTTTTYGTSSDYRLKKDVIPMSNAIDKIAQLKPVNFKWKETDLNGQGFIAHELQEVFPESVVGEKDAANEDGTAKYQVVDTSFLVATLTAAIQEQQAMIEELTNRIKKLEEV